MLVAMASSAIPTLKPGAKGVWANATPELGPDRFGIDILHPE